MKHLKKLLEQAWQRYLDDYEENPTRHEEPLIVKVGRDLKEAVVYESEMAPFINRNENFIFNLEFNKGRPTNLDAIAARLNDHLTETKKDLRYMLDYLGKKDGFDLSNITPASNAVLPGDDGQETLHPVYGVRTKDGVLQATLRRKADGGNGYAADWSDDKAIVSESDDALIEWPSINSTLRRITFS